MDERASIRDQDLPRKPFLKWAGGKRWLSYIAPSLKIAITGRYFEPFLGGGAMFFALSPSSAVLSDTNAELIEAYQVLRDDWASVVRHLSIHAKEHSQEHYYAVRAEKRETPSQRAADFIYLNRTCWNGLYRVNKRGQFNVPIGTKQTVLMRDDDFSIISSTLKKATLEVNDFEAVIEKAAAGDLIFADPPYTVRHKYNGFIKYNEILFSWADQVRLRNALVRAASRGACVILTNADHESVRELYRGDFDLLETSRFSSISSSGASRGNYSELLIIAK